MVERDVEILNGLGTRRIWQSMLVMFLSSRELRDIVI